MKSILHRSLFYRRHQIFLWMLAAVGGSVVCGGRADAESAPALPAAPSTPAPPYSLPWQLRPAAAATVVRSDTSLALFEDPKSKRGGSTLTSMLLGSYKLTPEFAPIVRLGIVHNAPPDVMGQAERTVFLNPVLGGTYVFRLSPDFRLAGFLGVALPLGGGGGNSPDAASATARGTPGILSRTALDNAMFAVNDLVIFPGIDVAYVAHGLTVQAEATLLQLTRVRGAKKQVDSSRTNLTAGVHVGYFILPELSAGVELRYQRWLSTPDAVKKDMTGALRDTLSMAIGVRAHFKLGDAVTIRPGLAYARGLDDPMAKSHYNIVQLDVPVYF
jgi:hypothetical protein